MKMNLYCVRDIKVNAYMQPFSMQTDAHAMRAFTELVKDKNTTVSKYPADFNLHCLGKFDDSDGELITDNRYLCSALDVEADNSNFNGDDKNGS